MAKIETKIFIETQEVKVIKRKRNCFRAYCEHCRREVSLLPPADAASLMCCETEDIYSLMNSNKIHFRYLNNRKPFVCLTSVCLV